jgi:peptidoglycan/LPS O-acetylase OafA/YrhL
LIGNVLIYDFESEKLIPGSVGFSLLSFLIAVTLPYFERNRFDFLKLRFPALRQFIYYTSIFSYCLYLIHLPIYTHLLGRGNTPSVLLWVKLSFACGIAYVISYFSYYYFEEPILKWRDRIFIEKHA